MIIPAFSNGSEILASCLVTATGGTFNSSDGYIYASAAATPVVLQLSQFPFNYQYLDMVLESAYTAATPISVTMTDNLGGQASANTFSWVGTLQAPGTKTLIRLPYVSNFKLLTIVCALGTYRISSLKVVSAPLAWEFAQVAFGGTGQISGAITGTGVTDNGFNTVKQGSFAVLTANTGGVNYTFATALVAKDTVPPQLSPGLAGQYQAYATAPAVTPTRPSYYTVLLFSPVTCSVTFGSLTHTFRGLLLLTLDSVEFASLVLGLSVVNTSGSTVTVTMDAFASRFNLPSNSWINQVNIGA